MKVLFASAALVALAFASPAAAQSIDIDLNGNGGFVIGDGQLDVETRARVDGFTDGNGTILERKSISETATLAEGSMRIDSNPNRTNIDVDANLYAGAMQQNRLETNGSTGTAMSRSRIDGQITFDGFGLNIQGSGTVNNLP